MHTVWATTQWTRYEEYGMKNIFIDITIKIYLIMYIYCIYTTTIIYALHTKIELNLNNRYNSRVTYI